jgi:uncharacterized membrane protein YjgN (DUF898 family)
MSLEAAPTQRFVCTGKFFDVLGLGFKNIFLTVITLSLYRFWARTSMRRRVWSRVWIMDDPLEYTGSPLELLRGFLIGLPCFFLPAIFVYYIAPLMFEPSTAGLLAFGFYLVGVPLVNAARYWMRRYQLSRTRWRGIRMALTGSAWSFAAASSGWTLLETLSLGWYSPRARINRAKLMWENTRFGDQPFQFVDDGNARAKGLWWPFALGWFGNIVIYFLGFAIFAGSAAAFTAMHGAGSDPAEANAAMVLIALAVIAVCGLCLLVIWAPYDAAAMNRVAALLEIDGARFKLRAKTFTLLLITIAGWMLIIPSLGLLAPVAGFLRVRYVFSRLEIINPPQFATIGQSIVEGPKAGESLADAFDLDMGLGII